MKYLVETHTLPPLLPVKIHLALFMYVLNSLTTYLIRYFDTILLFLLFWHSLVICYLEKNDFKCYKVRNYFQDVCYNEQFEFPNS